MKFSKFAATLTCIIILATTVHPTSSIEQTAQSGDSAIKSNELFYEDFENETISSLGEKGWLRWWTSGYWCPPSYEIVAGILRINNAWAYGHEAGIQVPITFSDGKISFKWRWLEDSKVAEVYWLRIWVRHSEVLNPQVGFNPAIGWTEEAPARIKNGYVLQWGFRLRKFSSSENSENSPLSSEVREGWLEVWKIEGGIWKKLPIQQPENIFPENGVWYSVQVLVRGNTFEFWVDNKRMGIAFDEDKPTPSGYVSISQYELDSWYDNLAIYLVDITPPISRVEPIEPYWQFKVPFTITATATDDLSGVASVELWYRHSYDNKTWGPWENFGFGRENAELPGQWTWEFTCPENDGYYEFYSVATDKAGNRENAEPKRLVPDAKCGVLDALRWFPIFVFSSDERYLPCSFYFDYDANVDNNPSNYDGGTGLWDRPYCYVHPIENGEYLALHYWLYYAYNSWGAFYGLGGEHDHDWERLGIVFRKDNLKEPWKVAFYHHIRAEDELIFWDNTEKEETHVLTYVASGSHGTYPSAREADAAWADSFERPGMRYSPEFFHVYIVGECVKENTYGCFPGPWWYRGHETREFCLVQNRLIKGDPQPEPLGGYWPKNYPGSGVAPWYRDEWNELLPGRRARSAFILNAFCPILVKVYDPAGRCVGIDFESREIVAEIPDAIVAPVRGNKLYIEILNPPSGEFRIEVYGLENGRYSLKASLLDLENEQICYRVIIENQPIRSSEIQRITFDSRSPKSYKWRAEGLSRYALKLHSKPENIFENFLKRKLELISSFIDKSMENWIDDWHLRFPMGLKVFDEELVACELSREVLKARIDQKTKDLLVEMMANLVQADNLLARKSIEEAERIAKGARILLLEVSKLKYQKADQAAQKGLFEQAIILYKQTWKLSQLCFL